MSFDREVEVLIEQAGTQRRLANWQGAIELLSRALSIDPDHAVAHASLALALLGARRVPGAAIEASLALAFDANDAFCHYAMAEVAIAERKLDLAWTHALVAMQTDTTDVDYQVLGAQIRHLRNESEDARQLVREALELDANHTDALVLMARLELEARDHDAAARYARAALESAPEDADAHVIAGYVALVRGDDAQAERHARFALNQDASHAGALRLWCSIKARRSPLMGLWWRFNAFVSIRSEAGQLGLLIGAFVLANLAIIFARHFDLIALSTLIWWGWTAFAAYTWVAPELFRKWLKSELGTVQLDPDY